MGVLYARVNGQWVATGPAPAPPAPDEVWVGPNTPGAVETELWVDSDAVPAPILNAKIGGTWTPVSSGASGGTDEVWIGTDDPIAAHDTIELWFDSDDEPAAVDNANYWNSAWGVVARTSGSNDIGPISVAPSAVVALPFTAVQGRQYRAAFYCTASSNIAVGIVFHHRLYLDNATTGVLMAGSRQTAPVAGAQFTINLITDPFTVVGGAHTVYFTYQYPNGTQFTVQGSWEPWYFVVEDMGPVTRAAVNPPAGQPQIATAGNALGIVAVGAPIAGTVVLTANAYTAITNPLTTVLNVGRRYRLWVGERAHSMTVASNVQIQLLDNGTAVGSERHQYFGGGYDNLNIQWGFDGDGASHTFVVRLLASSALTVYNDSLCFFYLEDVGPNQVPALPIPDTPPGWMPVTFTNGFYNYGGTYQTCQYRKVGDVVYLRGLAARASDSALPMFTMPVGFRPPADVIFTVQTNGGSLRLDILSNGNAQQQPGAAGSQAFVTLANISYSVTP